MSASPAGAPAPTPRPQCAALAVLVREGRVLLVRRANPPDAGIWGFPGGRIEWGETCAEAAARELREETGIEAEPGGILRTLDFIERDGAGAVRFHYVMVAVLCRWRAGAPRAADDALEAAWFDAGAMAELANVLSAGVAELAHAALGAAVAAGGEPAP